MQSMLLAFLLFSQQQVTIQQIQGNGPTSPYVGQRVITTGVVTGVYQHGFFIEDTSAGPWSGIWVHSYASVARGDFIRLSGVVVEYYDLTELDSTENVSVLAHGYVIPPETLSTHDVANEMWESVLVTVLGAVCDSLPNQYGEWWVNDGSGPIMVDDMGYAASPTLGHCYNITGPVYYSYRNYKIEPRDANDVQEVVCPIRFTNVYFNPTLPDPDQDVSVVAVVSSHTQIYQDSLFYAVNETSSWNSVPHDSVVGSNYYYTIPHQPLGSIVHFYITLWRQDLSFETSDTLMYLVPDFSKTIPLGFVHVLDRNGVSILEGRTIKFTGKLTTGGELGLTYFLQDTSGGIAIYNPGVSLNRGDSVVGMGTVESYYGLAELKNVSFSLIEHGNEIPPQVVTCRELSENGEKYEGKLLRINGVTSTATFFPVDGTITVTDSTGTFTLFIDRDTDLGSLPVPEGQFDVVGVLSQHDATPPYTEGYQLVPRSHEDVIFQGNGSGEVNIIPPIAFPGDTTTLHFEGSNLPGNVRVVIPTGLEWSFDTADVQVSGVDSFSIDTTSRFVTFYSTDTLISFDLENVYVPDTTRDYIFMVKTSSGTSFRRIMKYPVLYTVTSLKDVQGDDYISPMLGDTVRIGGWVVGPSDVFSPSGKTTFWLYDGTDGVEAFSYSTTPPERVGDFIVLTGVVNEYNGLTQVTFSSDGITKVLSVSPDSPFLPTPDTLGESEGLNESLEGHLVVVRGNVATDPSRGGSGFNLTIMNGLTPVDLRILDATGIDVTQFHKGQVLEVRGIVSQYDQTPPFTSGYQLMPVKPGDIRILQGQTTTAVSMQLNRSVGIIDDGKTFTITVKSPSTAENTITIYDLEGRKIRTLIERHVGPVVVNWNLLDDYGQTVKLGMYIIQLKSIVGGKTKVINKLVLVTRRFK